MSTDGKIPNFEQPAFWCAKLRGFLQLPALPPRGPQTGRHRAQQPVDQRQPRAQAGMQAGMHRNQPVDQQPIVNQQPPPNQVQPQDDRVNLASQLDDLRNDLSGLDERIKLLIDAQSKAVLFRDVLRIQTLLNEAEPLITTAGEDQQQHNDAEEQLAQAQELMAKLESKLSKASPAQESKQEQPAVDLELEKQRSNKLKNIDVMYKRLIRADPQNAQQLLTQRKEALSSHEASDLDRFSAEAEEKTERLVTEGQQQANDAINEVEQDKLEGLSVDKQIELLGKLQGGSVESRKARQVAMAKLYEVMPLRPEFSNKEKKKRGKVLNALSDDPKIAEYREQWSQWSELGDEGKKQKEAALKYILAAQSKLMGIQKIPEIVFITKGKVSTDDSERFDQGSFGFEDRTLEINDHPDSDFSKSFDKSLVTMLHENTHNFQAELVDKLLDGTLTEKVDKEYYQQAMLFLMNQRAGYLVTPEGYETQPTERQAYEAEDEAKRRFGVDLDVLNAKAQARALVERMDLYIKQAEKQAKQSGDDFIVKSLKTFKLKLKDGMQADTAAEILKHYQNAQRESDGLMGLASNKVRLEVKRQEAEVLTARIDKLLKDCKSVGLPMISWLDDINLVREALEEVANGDEDSLDDVYSNMDAALWTWYENEPKIADAFMQAEAKV